MAWPVGLVIRIVSVAHALIPTGMHPRQVNNSSGNLSLCLDFCSTAAPKEILASSPNLQRIKSKPAGPRSTSHGKQLDFFLLI